MATNTIPPASILTKVKQDSQYKGAENIKSLGTIVGTDKKTYYIQYQAEDNRIFKINSTDGTYNSFIEGSQEYSEVINQATAQRKNFNTQISSANKEYNKELTKSQTFNGEAILNSEGLSQTGANRIRGRIRGEYPVSYYPASLKTTKQDRIKFSMIQVKPRTLRGANPSTGQLSGFSKKSYSESMGEVYLSVPNQITDSNMADWSSATMNPLEASMASLALGAMKGTSEKDSFINDFTKSSTKLMGEILKNIKGFASQGPNRAALQVLLAQQAAGTQGLLSRLGGVVANPNVELLFNSPTLRPFTFNFRMTPRNDDEAKNIKQIIRFFKQGMAVQTTDQDVFLKSPNVFKIQFQSGDDGGPHSSLPRIKTCALIGCDVDYTPDGSYMTIDDSTNGYPMTCYQMTLRFNEIEPVYSSDYNEQGLSTNDIGY